MAATLIPGAAPTLFQAGLLTFPAFRPPSHPCRTVAQWQECFPSQCNKGAGSQRRVRPRIARGSLFIRIAEPETFPSLYPITCSPSTGYLAPAPHRPIPQATCSTINKSRRKESGCRTRILQALIHDHRKYLITTDPLSIFSIPIPTPTPTPIAYPCLPLSYFSLQLRMPRLSAITSPPHWRAVSSRSGSGSASDSIGVFPQIASLSLEGEPCNFAGPFWSR
jgi:hypothetical protein